MADQTSTPAVSPPYLTFRDDGLLALRRVAGGLLIYESVWKFLIWMVLGPLGLALLHAAIRLQGEVAVANTQLVSFALSPLGFITLLLMATVSMAATFCERAGLYCLLHNALHGRRTTSWYAFGRTMWAGGRIVSVALLQVGLFLVVLIPFAAILFFDYKMLLTAFDINYYLEWHPWQFWVSAVVAGLVLLAAAVTVSFLYVRWAFAVPVALFEGKKFVEALRGSARLVKGWSWKVFFAVLCWELFRFVFYWLVFLSMKGANELVLHSLEHATGGVLGWVAALMIVDMLVFAGIGIVETTVFCLVITLFYENLRRRQPSIAVPFDLAQEGPARLPRRIVFASVTMLLAVVGIVAWQTTAVAHNFKERHKIYVTAHRAGAEAAPENSLEALAEAIKQGSDYAEIDVQRTKDKVVVVLHDQDLKRLTGDPRKIWDVTYEELAQLEYVTKPAKKKSKEAPKYKGVKIPTLEEFIETSKGHIKLNIELKYYPGASYDKGLAKDVVDMLEQLDFVDDCVITSLDPNALKEVRRLNPKIKTGVIVVKELGDMTLYDVSFLSLQRKMVNADLRHGASRKNLHIHAWEVENRADMELMIHLGVDNLITDRPKLAMEVRDWYENLSDVELVLFHFRAWLRS